MSSKEKWILDQTKGARWRDQNSLPEQLLARSKIYLAENWVREFGFQPKLETSHVPTGFITILSWPSWTGINEITQGFGRSIAESERDCCCAALSVFEQAGKLAFSSLAGLPPELAAWLGLYLRAPELPDAKAEPERKEGDWSLMCGGCQCCVASLSDIMLVPVPRDAAVPASVLIELPGRGPHCVTTTKDTALWIYRPARLRAVPLQAPLPFLDSFVSAAYVCWQCGLELALRATDASPIFNVSHVYMEELCLDHDGARKTCAELFSK